MKQRQVLRLLWFVLAASFSEKQLWAEALAQEAETRTSGPTVSLNDLRNLDEISIRLPGARIFASGNGPKKGVFKLEVLKGGPHCGAEVVLKDGRLEVTELAKTPAPPAEEKTAENKKNQPLRGSVDCIYDIHLEVNEAGSLEVDLLGYGHLEVDNWVEPIRVTSGRGLVAFSQIGDLSVTCKSCDLSGEDLDGDLKYTIDNGSIGVSQLTASVEGVSKGDVVLTWKKMSTKSHVNIQSKAGDVYITVPRNHPISLDLKAPRGEIYTKASSHGSGSPLIVNAELGTIRLLGQDGGKKKK